MSGFELLCSSQDSHYDQEQTLPQDIASSPLGPPSSRGNRKTIKPPTITPRRFTKFFTPRQTANGVSKSGRRSRSGRQLRDITRNALNRRAQNPTSKLQLENGFEDVERKTPETRAGKKRKLLPTPESSPAQSSPSKRANIYQDPIRIYQEEVETSDDEGSLCSLLEELKPFPPPVRRLREEISSRRLLQRSFGGMRAIGRGKIFDHCTDWQDQTATFYSQPEDCHSFRGSALPFCTAPCNTNPLIAIGDEEGGVRLLDSSSADGISFGKTHVAFRPHQNAIMDIAFSSDDYLFATASGDQTAQVIDMRTQQTRFIMTGHLSSVKQVRFQPGNDSVVATSSRDGSVQIWDLRCRGSEVPVRDIRVSLEGGLDEPAAPPHSQIIYANTCISIKDAHAARDTPAPANATVSKTRLRWATILPQTSLVKLT